MRLLRHTFTAILTWIPTHTRIPMLMTPTRITALPTYTLQWAWVTVMDMGVDTDTGDADTTTEIENSVAAETVGVNFVAVAAIFAAEAADSAVIMRFVAVVAADSAATRFAAAATVVDSGQPINRSSFDPVRMMVSLRSGPVEIPPTSTPAFSSRNLR
jgi:Zn-dependent alcohol dehydrogenase